MLGKPLIAWTIDTALQASAQRSGRVVVSTDDEGIAQVARAHGAEVPFMRPAELAQDTSTSMDVVFHALEHFESAGVHFDIVCLLEPTSPQRTVVDVVSALERLDDEPNAQSIVGIGRVESTHPAFLVELNARGYIEPWQRGTFKPQRRQELGAVHFLEGSVYAARTSSLKALGSFYNEHTIGFIMPKWKTLEVDDMDDFAMIEALMELHGTKR